jgi:superfamily I DNA/RNA helicase
MSVVVTSVDIMSQISWDPEQRAVLDLPVDASGTIVGAPGSGKTAVLVERVARLIGDGAPLDADQVIVLTPSRASATRLRDRLGQRVGVATPGALARSVGSFAFQVVRADLLLRGEQPPELLTGAEQDRILSQVIAGDIDSPRIAWPAHLGETVRRSKDFRSELRAFIDAAIELGVSREELAGLAGGAWKPIAELTEEYGAVLNRMSTNAMGAAELVGAARRALAERQELPGIDRLRVVLVDDAQELTLGGVGLVEALRARGVAVLAAGDPDIASGAFRGITPDLFGALVRALGEVHVLRGQHRSSDEIEWIVRRTTQAIGAGGLVDHRQAPGVEPVEWRDVRVVKAARGRSAIRSRDPCASSTSSTACHGAGWRSSRTTPASSWRSSRNSPRAMCRHAHRVCPARSGASARCARSSRSCVSRSHRRPNATSTG